MKTIINLTTDEATKVCSALAQYALDNGWSEDELEDSEVVAEYGGAVDVALKAMGIEVIIEGEEEVEEEEDYEDEDYEDKDEEDYEDEDEEDDEEEEDDEDEEDCDEMMPDEALKAIFRAIGDLMEGYGE